LKSLATEEQVIAALEQALDFSDVRFDQAKVDKNYDILCHLIDYNHPNFIDKAAHFLNDPDERVRFAATEFLVEQKDGNAARHLERFIADTSADNIRIRQAVITAFESLRWEIKDKTGFPNGQIDGRLFVNSLGHLERRL
jgi:HEAT repeat protein